MKFIYACLPFAIDQDVQGVSGVLILVGYFHDSFLHQMNFILKGIGLYGILFGQNPIGFFDEFVQKGAIEFISHKKESNKYRTAMRNPENPCITYDDGLVNSDTEGAINLHR